jgi:hypothetical protein
VSSDLQAASESDPTTVTARRLLRMIAFMESVCPLCGSGAPVPRMELAMLRMNNGPDARGRTTPP